MKIIDGVLKDISNHEIRKGKFVVPNGVTSIGNDGCNL